MRVDLLLKCRTISEATQYRALDRTLWLWGRPEGPAEHSLVREGQVRQWTLNDASRSLMTNEFTQLGLSLQLVQTVTDLGYTTATPVQSKIIPLVLAGHDVIGQAWTLAKAGKYRIRQNAVTLELA